MSIVVTGADGYMGWPTMLKLSKEFDERIIGVDNLGRRRWVEEVGSQSMVPIKTMEERLQKAKELGFKNISFIRGDLTDKEFTRAVIKNHKPKIVLHLAAQPSAPYSHINLDKAYYSQKNNVLGTLNLLWSLREEGLIDSHFIETTTTGIYGSPNLNIPEGFLEVSDLKGNKDILPYPNIAYSFYHVTKGFDATNMWLMNLQTGLPCSDVRTSIVYGTDTEETKLDPELSTRFDIDFYFGTLFNRWTAMILSDRPLTVYGSGNQIKPFISLEDACQSLVEIAKGDNDGEYRVYNQLVEYVRIKELAENLNSAADEILGKSPGIDYIPNPRKEKEESEYTFNNTNFEKVFKAKHTDMSKTLPEVLERLKDYSDIIKSYRDIFI